MKKIFILLVIIGIICANSSISIDGEYGTDNIIHLDIDIKPLEDSMSYTGVLTWDKGVLNGLGMNGIDNDSQELRTIENFGQYVFYFDGTGNVDIDASLIPLFSNLREYPLTLFILQAPAGSSEMPELPDIEYFRETISIENKKFEVLNENPDFDINISPNPFNSVCNITYESKSPAVVYVSNIMGERVASYSMKPGRSNHRFDASKLPSGIYYAHFLIEDRDIVKRLMYVK